MMIRLEPEHKEALRQLALDEGTDMTGIVRPLILKRLGREEQEETPHPTIVAAGAALPRAGRKMVVCRLKKGK